jgi:large subunit ribosomal protein L17
MAMLRNMVTSLIVHERIRTTDAKAKEVRRLAEKMITLGKRGDLHARRQALAVVRGRQVVRKLFDELADRYREVQGGYTRIMKLGPRRGDGAMVSLVELVQPQGSKKKTAKRKGKKEASAKTKKAPSTPQAQEAKGKSAPA